MRKFNHSLWKIFPHKLSSTLNCCANIFNPSSKFNIPSNQTFRPSSSTDKIIVFPPLPISRMYFISLHRESNFTFPLYKINILSIPLKQVIPPPLNFEISPRVFERNFPPPSLKLNFHIFSVRIFSRSCC